MKDEIIRHKGMADASAGVHLSRDRFLVVSDESDVFQIFDATQPGRSLQKIRLSDVIDVEKDGAEIDLEGSARVGNVTFWISSHSRDADGKLTPERHRMFAMLIKGKKNIKMKQLGKSYTTLAYDLIYKSPISQWTDERLEEMPIPDLTKSERALNIEGLACYEGGLVLGFRSPLAARRRAIILPVVNPLEMVMFGSSAVFGEPILLDLGGRGIRSIDYWNKRDCYLICANDPTEANNPAYFLWSGKRDSKPKQLRMPEAASELSPEGVVFLGKRRMLILSDDGAQVHENGHNGNGKSGNGKNGGGKRKKNFRTMLIKVS